MSLSATKSILILIILMSVFQISHSLDIQYTNFLRDISHVISSDRIIVGEDETKMYAADTSFYYLVPKVVVMVNDEAEVVACLKASNQHGVAITFRAGGTSLAGQAISDSVLLLLAKDKWISCDYNAQTNQVKLQPGLTGEKANQFLAPHQKKIGPDPASIRWAQIGGMASTNASGICCRTHQNSYHTVADMRLIFADGTLLDTSDKSSCQAFRKSHAKLLGELEQLAHKTQENKQLADKIRTAYAIKNTTGYSLNALIDYCDSIEIIKHLIIGAEGTLGFIAQITLATLPDHPHKATSFVFYPDIKSTCQAAASLKDCPVSAVEFLDANILQEALKQPNAPAFLKDVSSGTCALLIETRAYNAQDLQQNIAAVSAQLHMTKFLGTFNFTDEKQEYESYWKLRKSLLIYAGQACELGQTVIIEDVAVTRDQLAGAVQDIQKVLEKYRYEKSFIFGHALDGNIHFVFAQGFDHPDDLEVYEKFMDDMATIIVGKYHGSLKGEHGTGRNIAPFVEMEWGTDAYKTMQRIKQIFDPKNILNPGVILNADSRIHVKNLKKVPATKKYDYSWLK